MTAPTTAGEARRARLVAGFRRTPADDGASRYAPVIAESDLRAALKKHHEWHLQQTDPDQHGIVPAEAYSESLMCDETMRLLLQEPTPWVPVSPALHSRVKEMHYALAYDARLESLRDRLVTLLGEVRRVTALASRIGSGLPVEKLRRLRRDVQKFASVGGEFATLLPLVDLLDEAIGSKRIEP